MLAIYGTWSFEKAPHAFLGGAINYRRDKLRAATDIFRYAGQVFRDFSISRGVLVSEIFLISQDSRCVFNYNYEILEGRFYEREFRVLEL